MCFEYVTHVRYVLCTCACYACYVWTVCHAWHVWHVQHVCYVCHVWLITLMPLCMHVCCVAVCLSVCHSMSVCLSVYLSVRIQALTNDQFALEVLSKFACKRVFRVPLQTSTWTWQPCHVRGLYFLNQRRTTRDNINGRFYWFLRMTTVIERYIQIGDV